MVVAVVVNLPIKQVARVVLLARQLQGHWAVAVMAVMPAAVLVITELTAKAEAVVAVTALELVVLAARADFLLVAAVVVVVAPRQETVVLVARVRYE